MSLKIIPLLDTWTVKGASSTSSKHQKNPQNQQPPQNNSAKGRGRGKGRGKDTGSSQSNSQLGRGQSNRNTSATTSASIKNDTTTPKPATAAVPTQPPPQPLVSSSAWVTTPKPNNPNPNPTLAPTNVPKLAWASNTPTPSSSTSNLENNKISPSATQQLETNLKTETLGDDVKEIISKTEKLEVAGKNEIKLEDETKLSPFPLKPKERFSLGTLTKFSTNHFIIPWTNKKGFDFNQIKQYDVTIRDQKSPQKRVIESTSLGK